MFDDDDGREYRVVINAEEQYSIWPADRPLPPGWQPAGPSGGILACLSYISAAWTDMRPFSLRYQMDSETK